MQYGFIEQIKGVLIVGFSNVPPSLVSTLAPGRSQKQLLAVDELSSDLLAPTGSIDQRPLKMSFVSFRQPEPQTGLPPPPLSVAFDCLKSAHRRRSIRN